MRVVEGSSERMVLPRNSVDLVLTDPPYHDDVQYGELSLPFRAWAQQSIADLESEAVVNGATGKNGTDSYRELLSRIFSEARRAMKEDGHLIFSYANRDPRAWADVLGALQAAGFEPIGYQILHSENETDFAKRGGRACTLDLIMDLVPSRAARDPYVPPLGEESAEHIFLRKVGHYFLRVGSLHGDWEDELTQTLRRTDFLSAG